MVGSGEDCRRAGEAVASLQFRQRCAANGWRTEMVWFESINREPDADTGGEDQAGDTGGK